MVPFQPHRVTPNLGSGPQLLEFWRIFRYYCRLSRVVNSATVRCCTGRSLCIDCVQNSSEEHLTTRPTMVC